MIQSHCWEDWWSWISKTCATQYIRVDDLQLIETITKSSARVLAVEGGYHILAVTNLREA